MGDGFAARLRRDAGLALAVAAPALFELSTVRQGRRTVLAAAIVLIPAGLLALRRRDPAWAFAAVLLTSVAGLLLAVVARAETSSFSGLPAVAGTFFLATHLRARSALVLAGGGLAVLAVVAALNARFAPPEFRGGREIPLTLAAVAAAWALGVQWRAVTVELALAGERAGRAVRAERDRIARDMHDIAGHHLTQLVVRAEALRARRAELPPWTAAEVDALAADGRRAVNDVRATLRLLREPGGEPPAPAPGLTDLPELVDRVRSGGLPVTYHPDGVMESVDAGAALAAYRVVQEGLTNVRRHAPGATTRVTVAVTRRHVRVVVDNDAAAPARGGAEPGLGLTGLRERVAALGGELRAAPTADGGFRLAATVPLGDR